METNIFFVTVDASVENAVKTALKDNKDVSLTRIYGRLTDLSTQLSDRKPSILVVDIDREPSETLMNLHLISNKYPEKRVAVISSTLSQDLILQSMHSGARHFLLKENLSSEIVPVLKQLLPHVEHPAVKLGSVITVFSASGGCGATTVAVNLANELQLLSSQPVLMIDLDNYYGTLSAYLGFAGTYGIKDVLDFNGQIDKNLIESCAFRYSDSFHVLAHPVSLESPKTLFLRYDKIVDAMRASRESYKFTVIDAPRLDDSLRKGLARESEIAIIVFQGTVKDINYTKAILASLLKAGIPREKIFLIANRFKKRGLLMRMDDIKKALDTDSIYPLRSDWRKTLNSLNHGKPLSQAAPWSGLRKEFQILAAQVDKYISNGSSKGW